MYSYLMLLCVLLVKGLGSLALLCGRWCFEALEFRNWFRKGSVWNLGATSQSGRGRGGSVVSTLCATWRFMGSYK